ncbi:hypothetical protein BU16DRAFT_523370 [Lophium mytilinum]|uniref:Uncharacterized protein n=1 Tax=Lophium mytilinum TaxID=390894 RepID=A0A6A6R880_9PEZI|nr:hypothetical protein BU16DRAFT_523370 [Lophium mytilinum]
MCASVQLANRELYVFLVRLTVAFEVVPARDIEDRPVLDALGCSENPSSLTTVPKPFKVGFKVRDRGALDKWILESEMRTAHLV